MVLPGRGMGWKEFGRALAAEWKADDISNTAGALTFFGLLSIFPFLLFVVSLAGFVIDPAKAESLIQQLSTVAPGDVSSILGGQLKSLTQSSGGGLLTFGVIAALWSASSGIATLIQALNRVYDVDEGRPFWKVRLIAIGTTIGAAILSFVAVAIMLGIPAVAKTVGGPVGTLINWLRIPVAGLLMMFVWASLFYVLPDVQQKFRFITPGTVIGVVVWVLASWGFSVYVSHFGNYQATYGALGGVIVMLLWMWISSMVILMAAEVNAILEHRSGEGKRRGAKSRADTGESAPSEANLEHGEIPPGERRPPEQHPPTVH